MKKRFVILITALLFLTGAVGYRALNAAPRETFSVTVLLRVQHLDNALAERLRGGEYTATLDGASATVKDLEITPAVLSENSNGKAHYYSSMLYSDAVFTLSMRAQRRDGVCYADGVLLVPGKKVLLHTPIFDGYTEILTVKWDENT